MNMTLEEENRLNMLLIVYDVVHFLGNGIFYCASNKSVEIINIDGNIVLHGTTDNLQYSGHTLIKKYIINRAHCISATLHNYLSSKTIEITDYDSEKIYTYNDIIVIRNDNESLSLYNSLLELIGIISGYIAYFNFDNSIRETEDAIYIKYWNHGGYKEAKINKQSNSVEYLCISKVATYNNDVLIAATEYCNKGYSINRSSIDNYKYRQYKDNKLTDGKSYQDITLVCDNNRILCAHDYNSNGLKSVGLIDNSNSEILPVIYKDITYIGSNNFKVDCHDNKSFIFNAITGTKSNIYNSNNIIKHETLPFTFINKESQTIVLDCWGRLFDINDLSKYYECYYNSDDINSIMIVIGGIPKYVTKKFVPITNINKVVMLRNKHWNKINS